MSLFFFCLNLLKLLSIKHFFDFFFENYHEFFNIFCIDKHLLIFCKFEIVESSIKCFVF